MKKVYVREENDGSFPLRGFGRSVAGADGKGKFTLVIEGRHFRLEFPEATVFDLFTRVDIHGQEFTQDRLERRDFVRVEHGERELVVQAHSGSLYDFFKERAALEECALESRLPVSFYWDGSSDSHAA